MRRSQAVLVSLFLGVSMVLGSFMDAGMAYRHIESAVAEKVALVAALKLTDLALFTEARYTRHLSQADRHSAFQDHPLALEHFPSGSLVLPPGSLRKRNEL